MRAISRSHLLGALPAGGAAPQHRQPRRRGSLQPAASPGAPQQSLAAGPQPDPPPRPLGPQSGHAALVRVCLGDRQSGGCSQAVRGTPAPGARERVLGGAQTDSKGSWGPAQPARGGSARTEPSICCPCTPQCSRSSPAPQLAKHQQSRSRHRRAGQSLTVLRRDMASPAIH